MATLDVFAPDGNSNKITITVDTFEHGVKSQPLLAELGIISTAINRAINDIATPRIEDALNGRYYISRQSAEPILVRTSIIDIRQGSIVVDAIISTASYISANETSIVTGIIASAVWDGAKTFQKHLKRAATRLGGSYKTKNEPPTRTEPYLSDDTALTSSVKIDFFTIPQAATAPTDKKIKDVAMRKIKLTIDIRDQQLQVEIEYDQNKNFYQNQND